MKNQSVEADPFKELIRQLAYEWAKVELPGSSFLYQDYIRIIGQLLTATQSRDRTEHIFRGILQQAVQLGKSSSWVQREVKFESLAEITDRAELILLHLKHSTPLDDMALDCYNERKSRFSPTTH